MLTMIFILALSFRTVKLHAQAYAITEENAT
jgi:hypothetical protein